MSNKTHHFSEGTSVKNNFLVMGGRRQERSNRIVAHLTHVDHAGVHEGEQVLHNRRSEFEYVDRGAANAQHLVHDGRLKFKNK